MFNNLSIAFSTFLHLLLVILLFKMNQNIIYKVEHMCFLFLRRVKQVFKLQLMQGIKHNRQVV